MTLIPRKLAKALKEVSEEYPVVGIFGPRQSGKTTLARETFPDYQYVSVEDEDTRAFAMEDPRGFFKKYRNKHGIIIDEIQQTPGLLSSIQTIVDEEKVAGQFIITGSHNMQLNATVSQSLSGRIGELTLLPLSIAELASAHLLPETAEDAIFKGGYPKIFAENVTVERLYKNYVKTYIERDVRQIRNIDNLLLFKKFMKLCAARIGQIVNLQSLASDCGIDVKTARSWLTLLEAAYILFLLPPYFQNYGKRVIQTPKLYFYDTGIVCSLLRIRSAEEIEEHYLRGYLFENLMIADFYKQYYNAELEPAVHFWRDRSQEVDCIIEEPKGLKAIEIKSGSTVAQGYFSQLLYWNQISGTDTGSNYLIYAGSSVEERNNGTVMSWAQSGELISKFL